MKIHLVPMPGAGDPVDCDVNDTRLYPFGIGVIVKDGENANGESAEPVERVFPWSSLAYWDKIGAMGAIIVPEMQIGGLGG